MARQEGSSYTFPQIFDLPIETEEIIADLGYRYRILPLSLPYRFPGSNVRIDQLEEQMQQRLGKAPLATEEARRALYISPLLFAVLDQLPVKMLIGHRVTGTLAHGKVDYLLRGEHDVVVTGVRVTDMARGFSQLAAQLIAVSEEAGAPTVAPKHPRRARKARRAGRVAGNRQSSLEGRARIFGAVTTGTVWQFGVLERGPKTIIKDKEEYLLPRDVKKLIGAFLGMLAKNDDEEEF